VRVPLKFFLLNLSRNFIFLISQISFLVVVSDRQLQRLYSTTGLGSSLETKTILYGGGVFLIKVSVQVFLRTILQ
jgi:hypothetical protein